MRTPTRIVVVLAAALITFGCANDSTDERSDPCTTALPLSGSTPEAALDAFFEWNRTARSTSTTPDYAPPGAAIPESDYVRDDDARLDSAGEPLISGASEQARFAHYDSNGSVDAIALVVRTSDGWEVQGVTGKGGMLAALSAGC